MASDKKNKIIKPMLNTSKKVFVWLTQPDFNSKDLLRKRNFVYKKIMVVGFVLLILLSANIIYLSHRNTSNVSYYALQPNNKMIKIEPLSDKVASAVTGGRL